MADAVTYRLSECARESGSIHEVCQVLRRDPDLVSDAYHFIRHVFDNHHRAIVDIPCGAGKTTAAYALILDRMKEKDSGGKNPNRLWWVVPNLKAGQEHYENLQRLGMGLDQMGFYHAFWADECNGLRHDKLTYAQIVRDRGICDECAFRPSCLSHEKAQRIEVEKPVVIMSHEGYIRLHERGDIAADVDIIVDEELANFYCTFFTLDDLRRIQANMPYDTDGLLDVRNLVTHLIAVIQKRHHCTVKWERGINWKKRVRFNRELDQYFQKKGLEPRLDNPELNEHMNWYKGKISELGYAIPEGFLTYVSADNDRVYIARNRMGHQIPNRMLFLNGSATVLRFPNEPVEVIRCKELVRKYDKVSIITVPASSTKRWLRDDGNYYTLLKEGVDEWGKDGKVFIATNKGINSKQQRIIHRLFPEASIGTRIALIGSNEWREYDNGIIAMSLFSKLQVYALMASLRNDREYSTKDLYKMTKDGRLEPNILSNRHLSCPDIDLEFQIHAAYEIHQTIMRLSCREQFTRQVNAVVPVPYPELITHLHKLMPGIQVSSSDTAENGLYKLMGMIMGETFSETLENTAVYDMTGLDKGNPSDRDLVKRVMKQCGMVAAKSNHGRSKVLWEKGDRDREMWAD